MDDQRHIDTGGGASVGGDVDAGRDVTGRDRANVTVNVGSSERSANAPAQTGGRIMPEVEQELRRYIYDLTKAVSSLEVTVTKNNDFSKEQIATVKEQIVAIRQQSVILDRQLNSLMGLGVVAPARPLPSWAPIAAVIFLGVSSVCLILLLLYFTVGGPK